MRCLAFVLIWLVLNVLTESPLHAISTKTRSITIASNKQRVEQPVDYYELMKQIDWCIKSGKWDYAASRLEQALLLAINDYKKAQLQHAWAIALLRDKRATDSVANLRNACDLLAELYKRNTLFHNSRDAYFLYAVVLHDLAASNTLSHDQAIEYITLSATITKKLQAVHDKTGNMAKLLVRLEKLEQKLTSHKDNKVSSSKQVAKQDMYVISR